MSSQWQRSFLISFSPGTSVRGSQIKSKSCGSFFSDEISLILFWGNTWSDKMSNQKRIGLEGTIKAYAGCSRIIATIQRASSTELPAGSGEKRRRAVSGEGQAVLCVQTTKKRPFSLT